jgi:hypothetical protein
MMSTMMQRISKLDLGPRSLIQAYKRARMHASARRFAESLQFASPSKKPHGGPLYEMFARRDAGRGVWKWEHYFSVYERHLEKFVGTDVHVVEIGIYSGGSLELWREYFGANCMITGIDINAACRVYAAPRTDILIGDQADREFWRTVRERMRSVDVLIDDGGHQPEQQRITLEETLSLMKPGGVYICEDIHGVNHDFASYVHALAEQLNSGNEPRREADGNIHIATTPFQQRVASVHLYPFMIVIEMATHSSNSLRTSRRGTEWQPFAV